MGKFFHFVLLIARWSRGGLISYNNFLSPYVFSSMHNTFRVILVLCLLSINTVVADTLLRREWKVDGVAREALLHVPRSDKKAKPTPVVFAFHGHGGSMRNAARMFHIETLWPDSIVVYMQGLNTPGHLTDPEGKKPGWQRAVGDQEDRDLKFFDAVFATINEEYASDTNRVYSMGHSNGGAFTYLLGQARGNLFAAFAPSASLHRDLLAGSAEARKVLPPTALAKLTNAPSNTLTFVPKPILHVAGENDSLVKFQWQDLFLNALRKHNQCAEGKPWKEDKRCTFYKSKAGGDVYTYIHPGTHAYPAEAPEIIVKFFKEQGKR